MTLSSFKVSVYSFSFSFSPNIYSTKNITFLWLNIIFMYLRYVIFDSNSNDSKYSCVKNSLNILKFKLLYQRALSDKRNNYILMKYMNVYASMILKRQLLLKIFVYEAIRFSRVVKQLMFKVFIGFINVDQT